MTTTDGAERVELRPGAYHDSVALLQVSRRLAGLDGVLAAQVAMATDLNVEVISGMGFTVPQSARPNDLVVAVRASSGQALDGALAALDQALAAPSAGSGASSGGAAGAPAPPRTVGAAARVAAEAAGDRPVLALVSVPGRHAFPEAMDALEAGLDVMVFSDNVPVEEEVRLKREALARDLLVLGPDCGTAVVGGVGLGFANVVRPGPVGIVAASGTGAQQLMCLLDAAGVGVSACLGVGGRDLSSAVGGLSTLQALRMLDEDPATELIVVVSKPPAPEVEARVREAARELATPVRFALLGPGSPDLTEAARGAVEAVGGRWAEPRSWLAPEERDGTYRVLRGAFSGGTLCDEAMLVASPVLGPIASNIPLAGAPALGRDLTPPDPLTSVCVDFGDDELTRGRAHPMIDGSLRARWVLRQAQEAAHAGVGAVVLLDVVLGHGASPDPSAELARAIGTALTTVRGTAADLAVVVSLCGTEGDPQGLEHQARALQAAGASVHLSNAAATRKALELVGDAATSTPTTSTPTTSTSTTSTSTSPTGGL